MEVGKDKIIAAIQAAEKSTSGEIRVHLSNAKSEDNVMDAAKMHFVKLGMQKTQDRNGIILYLNPKLHKFAIFGDEGIHQKVGQEFWDHLSAAVSSAIKAQDITAGIVLAVHEIGKALKTHFPGRHDDRNELHNDVTHSS